MNVDDETAGVAVPAAASVGVELARIEALPPAERKAAYRELHDRLAGRLTQADERPGRA